jgi:2-oxoglutarate dehydrogenase E1 component
MSPKSLLRHPLARSPVEDFLPETRFHRLIADNGEAAQNPSLVERLIFCSGIQILNNFNDGILSINIVGII